MRKIAMLSVLFSVALLCVLARDSFAVMYKYVNEEGTTCIADDLSSVPEKLRSTAVLVSGPAPGVLPSVQKRDSAQPEPAIAGYTSAAPYSSATNRKSALPRRLLITAVVVFVCVVGLFFLGRAGAFNGHERIIPAARVVLACGALAYIVFAHGSDVAQVFKMAGSKIDAIQEKQAERGKRAGQGLKSLNQLAESADKAGAPDAGADKEE